MAIIMLCYARSGGTLLNKCLGSLPNTIVLSEVNPIGGGIGKDKENSFVTVYEQAKNWYNIELKNRDFKNAVFELEEYCINNNFNLIIRDWTIVNFAPMRKNHYQPCHDFLTLNELEELTPKVFAFARDSIDVWISRGMKNCDDFFTDYTRYIDKLFEWNIPIFKFEDFTKSPKSEFKKICDFLEIEYTDILSDFHKFTKVNGDIQLGNLSRGGKKSKIVPLKRKNIPFFKINEINNCHSMIRTNKKVNYPTTYCKNPNMFIKINKTLSYYINWLFKKIKKKICF